MYFKIVLEGKVEITHEIFCAGVDVASAYSLFAAAVETAVDWIEAHAEVHLRVPSLKIVRSLLQHPVEQYILTLQACSAGWWTLEYIKVALVDHLIVQEALNT